MKYRKLQCIKKFSLFNFFALIAFFGQSLHSLYMLKIFLSLRQVPIFRQGHLLVIQQNEEEHEAI